MGQRFTQAQVDLALRKEQLILRVERGESLEAVSQDLGLAYHPKHVSRLRRRCIAGAGAAPAWGDLCRVYPSDAAGG